MPETEMGLQRPFWSLCGSCPQIAVSLNQLSPPRLYPDRVSECSKKLRPPRHGWSEEAWGQAVGTWDHRSQTGLSHSTRICLTPASPAFPLRPEAVHLGKRVGGRARPGGGTFPVSVRPDKRCGRRLPWQIRHCAKLDRRLEPGQSTSRIALGFSQRSPLNSVDIPNNLKTHKRDY